MLGVNQINTIDRLTSAYYIPLCMVNFYPLVSTSSFAFLVYVAMHVAFQTP